MFSMPLSPMGRNQRYQIHKLADLYGLKSNSAGKGQYRYPTLAKTSKTRLPSNELAAAWIEDQFPHAPSTSMSSPKTPKQRNNGRGNGKSSNRNTPDYVRHVGSAAKGPSTPGVRPKEGGLVGEHAQPIHHSNVGHQMLTKMGWDGGALGGEKKPGIEKPVEVIIKTNRRGLGFD
jgi:hypothetical protein